MKDYAHLAGYASYSIRQAVAAAWDLRMNPKTADVMRNEEAELIVALSALQSLVTDIHIANDSMKHAAE